MNTYVWYFTIWESQVDISTSAGVSSAASQAVSEQPDAELDGDELSDAALAELEAGGTGDGPCSEWWGWSTSTSGSAS